MVHQFWNIMNYKFYSHSPSDPHIVKGLGFKDLKSAQNHADTMNKIKEENFEDPTWNKEYWKEKPEPWIVNEV
jgi:hypothetical protein